MAGFAVTPERWDAGQRYIDALHRLGFQPETALWVCETNGEEYRLVLVSELVSMEGSAAIYSMLHKAFERAGTPPDLSPWIVEVLDTSHPLVAEIHRAMSQPYHDIRIDFTDMDGNQHFNEKPDRVLEIGEFLFIEKWVYFEAHRASRPARQQWKFFTRNVEALAA